MRERYRLYKPLLMFGDVTLTIMVLAAIVQLRPLLPGRIVHPEAVLPEQLIYIVVGLLWHAVFALSGVYSFTIMPGSSKELPRFTAAYVLASFIFAGLLFFTFREVSRMLIVYFCVADYMVLLLLRAALNTHLISRWSWTKPVPLLIVGASDTGRKLADKIIENHRSVLKLVGFVDNQKPNPAEPPAPIIGAIADLPLLIQRHEVGYVLLALPATRFAEAESLLYELTCLPAHVYLVPDISKLDSLRKEVDLFDEIMDVGTYEPSIQGLRRIMKRVLDLLLSSLLILLTWPILIIVWIAIKLDSPGPAIYAAVRVGEHGKIFKMFKFRSMFVGADAFQSQVTVLDEQGRPIYKVENDPRVTRLGRLLRRTSLDELPQLFNVIKGEMSLVGPRPEQPFITQGYDHWQWQRFSMPPGVTGWWQVCGRCDLPMHLNTEYDIYYVRSYTLLLDLSILVKTIGVVLRGKGAY